MYIVPNRNRNTRLTSTPRLEKKKPKQNNLGALSRFRL